MKSGQLAILGRPNVGKSTLLNALVREKIAIVSDKPQTTRNLILGVGHYPEGQLILIDTPGLHTPHHRMNTQMVQSALGTLTQSDVVYMIVDSQVLPGPGDRQVMEQVTTAHQERPFQGVFLLLNKADAVAKSRLLPLIDQYRTWFPWSEIIPISAKTGVNLPQLVELTFACLPSCPELMYDEDFLTNQPMRHMAAELIREKVLEQTYDELPYAVGVMIEEFQEEPDLTSIRAVILVEKTSQKGIIIGKKGMRLKEIGQSARIDMERLFGMKIYLRMWVKVQEGWRDNVQMLSELGYG
ncbi:MAG TPA: GTPase Era [Nitrospirales bacterium]|nr:GTPase Era [Nitrospira sp. MA-1]HNP60036.1 GTPase Era [Nitrospirales bacterium]